MSESKEGFASIEAAVTVQHEQRIELLKQGKLDQGVKIPGLQESIDILGKNLTAEQVAEILRLKKKFFAIEPGKPFTDYVSEIDRNKRQGQVDTYVTLDLQTRFAGMPVGGLRVGFAEGKAKLAGDPNLIDKKLKEQERLFKAGLATGVEVIHPRTDVLLQLDGMKTKELVDKNTWSPLEDNSTDRAYIPVSGWVGNQIVFSGQILADWCVDVRWRRAVMVSAT